MDLIYEFQTLLPKIIRWTGDHSEKIQKEDLPFTEEQLAIVINVGVSKPEKVGIQTENMSINMIPREHQANFLLSI